MMTSHSRNVPRLETCEQLAGDQLRVIRRGCSNKINTYHAYNVVTQCHCEIVLIQAVWQSTDHRQPWQYKWGFPFLVPGALAGAAP